MECFGRADCTSKCMVKNERLSKKCADCFGELVVCAVSNCSPLFSLQCVKKTMFAIVQRLFRTLFSTENGLEIWNKES